MPSSSEKQAHLMHLIATGQPVDAKYAKISRESAERMHAEDRAAGVFFHPDGKPRYNPLAPRTKAEMEEGPVDDG